MILAAILASLVCAATPVHGEPLPRSGVLAQLKWVQAAPPRAGIVGMLYAYDDRLEESIAPTFALWAHGHAPDGHATKILWLVRNTHAGLSIVIRGRLVGGTETFRQSFPVAGGGGGYPSIIVVPRAGCWRLDVSTGATRGTLVVKAVEP
jgi:hypothetical protein